MHLRFNFDACPMHEPMKLQVRALDASKSQRVCRVHYFVTVHLQISKYADINL